MFFIIWRICLFSIKTTKTFTYTCRHITRIKYVYNANHFQHISHFICVIIVDICVCLCVHYGLCFVYKETKRHRWMQRFVTFDIISEQNGKYRGIQTLNQTNILRVTPDQLTKTCLYKMYGLSLSYRLCYFFLNMRLSNMLCECLSFSYLI